MLDAHTREPITVNTQRYLSALRFFSRWFKLVRHQKSALFGSENRVERSHSIFRTNHHKFDITTVLYIVCMCVCVCVFSSHPFWTSSSLDVPAGVTQEEGHTGFLIHLPSAVRALIFVARRIQPFLSLVDREVEFCVLTN